MSLPPRPPLVVEAATVIQRVHEQVQREKRCDLSATCPQCNIPMEPEHAHYRCPRCKYRDSCCF